MEQHRTVSLKRHVLDILGDAVSLAGEKEIRAAWDQSADEGGARPRDKSQKRMYKLSLVATQS
jgi:hypothetical protein